jgi:hypothetical protein
MFEEYPIMGTKAKDFEAFKKVSTLTKTKADLTKEGLDEILLIKSKMNIRI